MATLSPFISRILGPSATAREPLDEGAMKYICVLRLAILLGYGMYSHVAPRDSERGRACCNFFYLFCSHGGDLGRVVYCTITLLMCMNMQGVNVTGTFGTKM